jgi:hypothetical protein
MTPLSGRRVYAGEEKDVKDGDRALGAAVDLFPAMISLSAGKPGFGLQAWAGAGHMKYRLVTASLVIPEWYTDRNFSNYRVNVAALIADYVFGPNFSGPWIGAGFELWSNSITHESTDRRKKWNNEFFTLGGGYIWRVHDNLCANPWAGFHCRLNDTEVEVAGDRMKRDRISASVSVKIEYYMSF